MSAICRSELDVWHVFELDDVCAKECESLAATVSAETCAAAAAGTGGSEGIGGIAGTVGRAERAAAAAAEQDAGHMDEKESCGQ